MLASNSPYILTPLAQTPPYKNIKSQWCFVIYTTSPQYKDMFLHITKYPNTRAAWLKQDWDLFFLLEKASRDGDCRVSSRTQVSNFHFHQFSVPGFHHQDHLMVQNFAKALVTTTSIKVKKEKLNSKMGSLPAESLTFISMHTHVHTHPHTHNTSAFIFITRT